MKTNTFIIVLLLGYFSFAQTGIIKGLVIDKQSEQPLDGATVQLLNTETATGVITNFDGRFTLDHGQRRYSQHFATRIF